MTIPGFTAEASLETAGKSYASIAPFIASGEAVIPQRILPRLHCVESAFGRCCCPAGMLIGLNPCRCIAAEF